MAWHGMALDLHLDLAIDYHMECRYTDSWNFHALSCSRELSKLIVSRLASHSLVLFCKESGPGWPGFLENGRFHWTLERSEFVMALSNPEHGMTVTEPLREKT